MTRIRLFLSLGLMLAACCAPPARGGEVMVGAYYYPWYGTYQGGHDVRQSLRGHLVPQQLPEIGVYRSRDDATIATHIDQSHRGNIDFWAVSWWGPRSSEDYTFRKVILQHPRRAELKYAVHYESTGRVESGTTPNFENLVPDFRYLARYYFGDPNYLKIDDRPVVFLYVTRAYFIGPTARAAVVRLRAAMKKEFGLELYLVGDDLLSDPVSPKRASLWDAITDFDVYGTAFEERGATSQALDHLAKVYDDARAALGPLGVAFIPTASPGFNDKGVRGGHPAAPRYFVDVPDSQFGDLFRKMLTEVVVPRTDPKAANILMINSFNEWHEDTQIEPAAKAPRTSADDSPNQRYSEGYYYEGYGDKYLKILRDATVFDRR